MEIEEYHRYYERVLEAVLGSIPADGVVKNHLLVPLPDGYERLTDDELFGAIPDRLCADVPMGTGVSIIGIAIEDNQRYVSLII